MMVKRISWLLALVWALGACCGCLAEEDAAAQAMKLYCGEKDGIRFALPGFCERLEDAEYEGHWKHSIQLAGTCAADGAEFQLRTADIGDWLDSYRKLHPKAKERDVMAQSLYGYSAVILSSYGAQMGRVSAKTLAAGTMLLQYDYTYPDEPDVAYRAKCLLRGTRALCLTMETCPHLPDVFDALCVAEAPSGPKEDVSCSIQGLRAVFPGEPVILEQESLAAYTALSDDWSYLSVQYIPARLTLPEDQETLYGALLGVAEEKVIPAIGGEAVSDVSLYRLGQGYMMAFSTVSTLHMGEYGQRWRCRLYVTDGGIWYVYAADTEDGAAFLSRIEFPGETPEEMTVLTEKPADGPAETAADPVAFDAFRARLAALVADGAFGMDAEEDMQRWCTPFYSDARWVRVWSSEKGPVVPCLVVYTNGPEADAAVTQVRVLGYGPGAAYGDTAMMASCAAEALAGPQTHEVLRSRLALRRKGQAPEETYGPVTWAQTYFSSTDTEARYHLITLTVRGALPTRQAVRLPEDEETLPDIEGCAVTGTELVEKINYYASVFYGGSFKAQLVTKPGAEDAGEGEWTIALNENILVHPSTVDGSAASPVLQVWITSVDGVAPNALAGTVFTYAALADLSDDDFLALMFRLVEYPLWGDLRNMQPLAARGGVMALLSDDVNADGSPRFMGWVAGAAYEP